MHKDDVDLRHVSPILDHPHPEDWAALFIFVSAEDGFLLPNLSYDVWNVEMSLRKWKMKWKPRHGVFIELKRTFLFYSILLSATPFLIFP